MCIIVIPNRGREFSCLVCPIQGSGESQRHDRLYVDDLSRTDMCKTQGWSLPFRDSNSRPCAMKAKSAPLPGSITGRPHGVPRIPKKTSGLGQAVSQNRKKKGKKIVRKIGKRARKGKLICCRGLKGNTSWLNAKMRTGMSGSQELYAAGSDTLFNLSY